MIISQGMPTMDKGWMNESSDIILRWREEGEKGKWERREKTVTSFKPYLYIDPNNIFERNIDGSKNKRKINKNAVSDVIKKHRGNIKYSKDYVNADGDSLWRIEFDSPSGVKRFQRKFSGTYEGDVPYCDRYLIDEIDEIPEFKPRLLFIDLEATQYRHDDIGILRNPKPIWADHQEISIIGCYDNFTDKYIIWAQHEKIDEELHSFTEISNNKLMRFEDTVVEVRTFKTEYHLLQNFITWFDNIDPDFLLAWGMGFYDLPTLYTRLNAVGLDGNSLSPSSLGHNQYVEKPNAWTKNRYRWTRQPISGRTVISLDRLFERVYRDSKSTNLPSNKLDIVGEKLFGQGKTEFRPDFYDINYHKFINDYIYYNFRDVKLMVDIEEKFNLTNGQLSLQQLAKCQFSSTFYGSSYARVYFMRKAPFKQKSGWYNASSEVDEDDKLQGAIVVDPEELGTVGLHKNVVILDYAGLYPSMMIAYNTSWETKVTKGNESDDDIIGDGCRFKREPMGILPTSVKELDGLRDYYKNLRDKVAATEGKKSEDYRKWDDAQKTVKRLRATFYGLMAMSGYAWGDMDIAKTITYGGRNALTRIMEESEKLGYRVIGGHTDSIFVALGDDKTPEECEEIAIDLGHKFTKLMQSELKSTAVEVEAEMIMDRFFFPRRNKYAGRVIWTPDLGHTVAELPIIDRMKITGLTAKHTNTSQLGRDIQIEALKLIWDDKPAEVVKNLVLSHLTNIRNGDVPMEQLFSRARLGQWLNPHYYSQYLDLAGNLTMRETDEIYTAGVRHYSKGATNETVYSTSKDEDSKCYTRLDGEHKGAAWHNIVLVDKGTYPKLDKGDSFYATFAKDGPTWIPSGGYIGFHNPSQIKDYEIDIEMIIEKHILMKLENIAYGMGIDLDELRPPKRKFLVSDYFDL